MFKKVGSTRVRNPAWLRQAGRDVATKNPDSYWSWYQQKTTQTTT